MTDAALSLVDVSKRYRTVTAVDRLSFEVAPQEIVALLGPNGAGKTTTVRMIQGILEPDEGQVRFGIEGAHGHVRPGLGYLPEDRGLYRDQGIGRILEIFGRLRGMSKSDARAATDEWLGRFDLADRRAEKLEALSKGNQQKVQFAAAVLHRPALAVLDEPFSGLDPVNQDLFLDLLREMRDGGTTILLSAHQMDLVERCVDRLLILGNGRKLLEDTVEGLGRRQSDTPRMRVAFAPGAGPPPEIEGDDDAADAGAALGADASAGDPVVASVTAVPGEDDRYDVEAHPGVPLPRLLETVSRWPGLTDVSTERRRLHEIYVDVVARATGTAPDGEAAP